MNIHAQAQKQAAQLAAIEKMGDPFVRTYVDDMQRRAIAAIKSGGQVKLSRAERQKIVDEMGDFMLLGFVRRYRQKKQKLGIELNLSFSREVAKLAKGLNLDLDGIQDKLTLNAKGRVNDSIDTMEDRINQAVGVITARQQTTTAATQNMRRKLDEMGLSLNNPSMAETLVRTHAQIAFGAAQYQLNQDDPHDTIWGYQYATVGDGRVRPEHAILDGMVRPKDDPIWQILWTPNGWNCRCQLIELTEPQKSTPVPKGAGPDKGFDLDFDELLNKSQREKSVAVDDTSIEARPTEPTPRDELQPENAALPATFKTPQQAEKVLGAGSEEWQGKLNDDDRRGVSGYAGTANSFMVNDGLRNGGKFKTPTAKITAERMKAALDKASMPQAVTGYRAINPTTDAERAKILESFKSSEGKSIVDKAFVSTTANKQYAETWSKNAKAEPINVQVLIPKGAKAAYLPKDMVGRQEWEIVLQAKSSFKVVSVAGNNIVLEMQ